MVWKTYQCRRCGAYQHARGRDEAAKLLRKSCFGYDPSHEPAPVQELDRQSLLEVDE